MARRVSVTFYLRIPKLGTVEASETFLIPYECDVDEFLRARYEEWHDRVLDGGYRKQLPPYQSIFESHL